MENRSSYRVQQRCDSLRYNSISRYTVQVCRKHFLPVFAVFLVCEVSSATLTQLLIPPSAFSATDLVIVVFAFYAAVVAVAFAVYLVVVVVAAVAAAAGVVAALVVVAVVLAAAAVAVAAAATIAAATLAASTAVAVRLVEFSVFSFYAGEYGENDVPVLLLVVGR